ncbi:MAG: ribonuclease HI [Gammaproteobacteria bacterium]|nr:ribonuclease HI [Gammaproteobacteria bacterium]
MITIYTDGSCLQNPGPGGWAWIALNENEAVIQENCGSIVNTTNNQMELTAAIEALQWVLKQPNGPQTQVLVYTDSKYVQQGISEWIIGWKKKNWRSSTGSPVKNQSFWVELDRLNMMLKVRWAWVKAHDTNRWNIHVDNKARLAAGAAS